MAKDKWISDRARLLIVEAALENPEESRRDAVRRAKRKLAEEGEKAPQDQTTEKEITNWRKNDRILKEARRETPSRSPARLSVFHDLDDPWSLGSLMTFNLPVDALGDLLEVWKLCLPSGWTMTIRHARWVALLRSTMPPIDGQWLPEQQLLVLYSWACQYALRERASEALGITNDTRDLDAALVAASEWEWQTAMAVGAMQRRSREDTPEQLRGKEDAIELGSRRPGSIFGALPHEVVETELGGLKGWVREKTRIPGGWSPQMIPPTPEESKVYAYWLRYLSKGPNWDAIPFERHNQIAVRLREEVQAVEAATKQYRDLAKEEKIWAAWKLDKIWGDVMQALPAKPGTGYSIGPEPGPLPPVPSPPEPYREPPPPFHLWQPKDLLKEVGYDD